MDSDPNAPNSDPYVVVARRYRPQSFQELVGQNQVAKALGNAIETNRVGHAYLFTGARGVGKTSTARIFSKCLNCETGPTLKPCDQCDICQSISAGEDVDVLEIDGASNRGIDEIRQLRTFATVRPSRSRFKIYIIDEVHMLTKEAFNALLKTLEEPPGHVKFIFCTTNPEKIPITVLSRCQRFDFAPVASDEIKDRLRFIVENEGAQADDDALVLLARRAGGSMRDSQSLLEQLLAFSSGRITVESVHHMLGTAPGGRVESLVKAIVDGQPGNALDEIHQSIVEGADAGQILEQLTAFFRDLMVLSVGGSEEILLQLAPDQMSQCHNWASDLGTPRILATLQIFDWALARMRQSTHTRSLIELAVVQACSLQQIKPLADAIEAVSNGEAPKRASGAVKKNEIADRPRGAAATAGGSLANSPSPAPPAMGAGQGPTTNNAAPSSNASLTATTGSVKSSQGDANQPASGTSLPGPAGSGAARTAANASGQPSASDQPASPLNHVAAPGNAADSTSTKPTTGGDDRLASLYREALKSIEGMAGDVASHFQKLQEVSETHWKVFLDNDYMVEFCTRKEPHSAIESAVKTVCGKNIRIDFASADVKAPNAPTHIPKAQQLRNIQSDPFVARMIQVFQAELTDIVRPKPASKPGS